MFDPSNFVLKEKNCNKLAILFLYSYYGCEIKSGSGLGTRLIVLCNQIVTGVHKILYKHASAISMGSMQCGCIAKTIRELTTCTTVHILAFLNGSLHSFPNGSPSTVRSISVGVLLSLEGSFLTSTLIVSARVCHQNLMGLCLRM